MSCAGKLLYKHIIARPMGANARSVVSVTILQEANPSGNEDSDSDSEHESDSDSEPVSVRPALQRQRMQNLVACMIHNTEVGSSPDSDNDTGPKTSSKERNAYSEGRLDLNEVTHGGP